nr:C1 family peptidase [bacterium]
MKSSVPFAMILLLVSILSAPGSPVNASGLNPPPHPESATFFCKSGREFPPVFDWRALGGVTPVKDQGFVDCYPCWAFCLIAAVESSVAIESGRMLDLSEQQLLDCNQEGYGCDGGWLDGWTILRDFGAVEESCYPYIGRDQACAQSVCTPVARVTGCEIAGNGIDDIKAAVMDHAPVACGMTVYTDFSFYSGGCYSHAGTEPMNHGVVIVGWDDTACDGAGAWIVKNSFGPEWGEDGFIMMEYGTCRIGAGARYFDVEMIDPVTPTPSPTPEDLTYTLTLDDTLLVPG